MSTAGMIYGKGDKELSAGEPQVPVSTGHKHHDTNVTFEEYHYWAKISRADERYEDPNHDYKIRGKVLKKSRHPPATAELAEANASVGISDVAAPAHKSDSDEKVDKELGEKDPQRHASRAFTVTDEEYVTASRAVRTATWSAVFYLITTDILGPFATPFAFAAVSFAFSLIHGYGLAKYCIQTCPMVPHLCLLAPVCLARV